MIFWIRYKNGKISLTMKNSIPIKKILFIFLFFYSSLLSAQTQLIEFNKTIHDFGDIMINSGKYEYTFTFKNLYNQPVVIQTVISSCGCTSPIWTKGPVLPGKSGKIAVTFKNDQGAYPFDKALTVYITGVRKPIILRIKGVVHDKQKSLKELFPDSIGDLSFRNSFIYLGNIAQGEIKTDEIEVANTTDHPIDISFQNLSNGLSLKIDPSTIEPGKRAVIQIMIDTSKEVQWGSTEYISGISINGKDLLDRYIRILVNIIDNFAELTKEEFEKAPYPIPILSTIDFGKGKAGEEIKTSFSIRNIGKNELIIHKVESENSRITIKHPLKIASGAIGLIDVKIDTSTDIGEKEYTLSLITNSPVKPVVNLYVKGQILQ